MQWHICKDKVHIEISIFTEIEQDSYQKMLMQAGFFFFSILCMDIKYFP